MDLFRVSGPIALFLPWPEVHFFEDVSSLRVVPVKTFRSGASVFDSGGGEWRVRSTEVEEASFFSRPQLFGFWSRGWRVVRCEVEPVGPRSVSDLRALLGSALRNLGRSYWEDVLGIPLSTVENGIASISRSDEVVPLVRDIFRREGEYEDLRN